LKDTECVNTTDNTVKTVSETTLKATATKKCVEVLNAEPATECLDDVRETVGKVVENAQSRVAEKCKLLAIAAGKCFDVTAQALADVSKDVRRDAGSLCFTLTADQCFENDAATQKKCYCT